MRLGGYVIHGNSAATLPACLDSLTAICDDVVAVDSQSTDVSAEITRTRGIRSINTPWRGYGAARSEAVKLLGDFDYLFFLDADEWVEPESLQKLKAWKQSSPSLPLYTVRRRNWVSLPYKRFLFFKDTRARLVRKDAAIWKPEMIVHEALPKLPSQASGALIEHTFATSVEDRAAKDDRYALLWALRANAEGRHSKNPALEKSAHLFRNLFIHGALFRGGSEGAQLAKAVARYHSRKYEYLAAIRRGEHAELQKAFGARDYERVFQLVSREPVP
ncbi:MAG: glycosyltransferase family 2 protein [Myxococcaceae bacterium]